MLMAMLARLGCEVSDLGILRDERASLASGLEEGRRRPRSDPHHRRRFDRRGGSRQGRRRERRHAGAVADGDQAGPSGRDGDHRRHAVHRPAGKSGGELCHLRPCGAADRAGAVGRRAAAADADAGARRPSPTRRRSAAANMSASPCARARMARSRRSSFRAKAQGCCRRWSIPTGWSNSAKQVTLVEPGQTVGFPVLCKPDLRRVALTSLNAAVDDATRFAMFAT